MRRTPILSALFALVATLLSAAVGNAQGMLIPGDESVTPLELRSHRVEFEVTDHGAVTHVTQVFRNHTSSQLEATYYFAIPEGAVTTDFALWMNGERIRGEVMPREQARSIYEGIVRRMRDPGLLEWVDGDLFQASIFPIPPNGDQTVEIEYASVLAQDGTMLRYTYPMNESAGRTIDELVISGTVHASAGIARIYSPRHDVDVVEDTTTTARVAFEGTNAATTEDFDLYVGLASDDVGFSFLTYDPDDGQDGYFMMTLTPSRELEQLEVLAKQVTFVVDTSGSMAGVKMDQAREMLHQVVDAMRPEDTFNVISFSTGVSTCFAEAAVVDRESVGAAHACIDALAARGNTNISGALERALDEESSPDRPHVIVFITDGLPTEGNTDVDDIIAIARQGVDDSSRRIFTFGVGYDVNTRLLDGVARRGRGQSGYVRPEERIGDHVGTFFAGVDAPLLTDLALDFGEVEVSDLYPNPLPDLYRGGQITVFGRFHALSSEPLTISGSAGRERLSLVRYPEYADFADTDKSFIANLWARRRVDELMALNDEEGASQSRINEIVALGTAWGIVTPYTSYLAVDPSERAMAGLPTQRPDPAPAGQARSGGWAAPTTTVADMPVRAQEAYAIDEGAAMDAVSEYEMQNLASRGRGAGGSVFGGNTGYATGGGAAPTSAPAAAAPAMPRAESGREAVEESIRRNRDLADMTLDGDDSRAAMRSVAGRSFASSGGIWIEAGLEARAADVTVDYLSAEYFELLAAHPELADVLALGERVRFALSGRVYEVR